MLDADGCVADAHSASEISIRAAASVFAAERDARSIAVGTVGVAGTADDIRTGHRTGHNRPLRRSAPPGGQHCRRSSSCRRGLFQIQVRRAKSRQGNLVFRTKCLLGTQDGLLGTQEPRRRRRRFPCRDFARRTWIWWFLIPFGKTQRGVYGRRLIFVSARTNKRHHHLQVLNPSVLTQRVGRGAHYSTLIFHTLGRGGGLLSGVCMSFIFWKPRLLGGTIIFASTPSKANSPL
jgi:hypothetical protein